MTIAVDRHAVPEFVGWRAVRIGQSCARRSCPNEQIMPALIRVMRRHRGHAPRLSYRRRSLRLCRKRPLGAVRRLIFAALSSRAAADKTYPRPGIVSAVS